MKRLVGCHLVAIVVGRQQADYAHAVIPTDVFEDDPAFDRSGRGLSFGRRSL